MNKPLVSIITPTYKSKDFILDTIQSVINQSYENWEMIIVDDASGDDIEGHIAEHINDVRIKVIVKDENEGAARARNLAIDMAQGEYIAFLDSDDTWDSEKLLIQVGLMLKNDWDFSFTSYRIINEDNKRTVVEVPKTIDYEGFLRNTIIGTSTVILNRGKLNNVHLVDVRQDHDSMTWLRIMRENDIKAYGINQILTNYYKRSDSISSDKVKAAKKHWKNLRHFEQLSFIKTLNVFIQYSFRATVKHFFQKEEE